MVPSPSRDTNAGRNILDKDPNSPGSLGISISEAIEDAATHDGTKYSLGSVLNHVLMHQTVIGLEAKAQLEKLDTYPDIVVGCVGGGSSFGGISFPFIRDRMVNGKDIRFIAVEPEACPTITQGAYTYDFGDNAAAADVHPGPLLCTSPNTRRRPTLPWHCPSDKPALPGGGH